MDKFKISSSKRDEIVNKLQQDIDAANQYYGEEIEPKILKRYAIYHSDEDFYKKMFPKLSERCSIRSTDAQDTISSIMPSLMKIFFGSTDVITIQGRDGSDQQDDRAQTMQELINYQLDVNRFFMTFFQAAQDGLITGNGILKVDWVRQYDDKPQQITLNEAAFEQFAAQAKQQNWQIVNVMPNQAAGGIDIVYIAPVLTVNQPRIMNLLASEFRYEPDATDLNSIDFIAHRKIVTLDYLRKQQDNGLYENVDKLAEKAIEPEYTELDYQNNLDVDDEPDQEDTGRQKVELYECYVNINMTDDPDGELTPMIITVSNKIILRIEKNVYGRHPFFILSPRIDPHKIWPDSSFVDLIAQIQHTKTAILRQVIYNAALSNDSQKAINLSMLEDADDITKGRAFIRVNGDIDKAIKAFPVSPIQSWTFNLITYLDSEKENRTGITKYNQGLDSNTLNKTATGINIITQQANQRLELIARIFAETGLYDMFRYLIKMNQLFINEPTVIRLTSGPITVDPTDLDGEFDLVVNAGMGAGAKQTNLQNLQMLQGVITQLANVGMAGPQQFYNCAKRIIEEIGYKNVDDFIIQPQQMQQKQEQPQESLNESVKSDISQAPYQVQMQYWAKQGYQVNPQMFTEQAATDALKTAVDSAAKNIGGNNGRQGTLPATNPSRRVSQGAAPNISTAVGGDPSTSATGIAGGAAGPNGNNAVQGTVNSF
ncbi:hypothetical protein [Pectinatus frisingensis]|uniref:portal protein n=1 Tax=Pectinatus frisingensis TaxID=865 RepID=UPI0018C5FB44|nr:hypothetical protein [Pectinatus frisingensis]